MCTKNSSRCSVFCNFVASEQKRYMQTRSKIILGIILAILAGAVVYLFINTKSKDAAISEMAAQFELEKEELTDEYSQLSLQYEGYGLRIGNDSLATLLDTERYKVQRLLEELKTTKATNARRIGELRKELESLRGIIKHYVAQIDSLNTINSKLKAENIAVNQRYQEAKGNVETLSEEKKVLTEKVTLASILDAKNISVETLTSKGRKATKISKTEQLKFTFTIAKNISAPTGEKYIYVRIIKPDDTPLVKSNDNVFMFENKFINYSARRPIEYEGEDIPVTIFWDVEEYLNAGKYRIEIFADGYMIGQSNFSLNN